MIFNVFGTINKPISYAGLEGGGLSNFISNLLALLATLGGLFVFINFIIAGYQYLSANGNPQNIANAGNKMLYSVIGLVIIAAAFVIASIVGLVFFGDAGYLLSPTFLKITP